MIDELISHLSDAPREWIARLERGRRVFGIARPDRIRLVGECWRLGAILLGADGTLFATGTVIRTEAERTSGHTSQLARDRAELRAAARRSRIPVGRTLNIDPRPLSLTEPTEPLRNTSAGLEVEWSPGLWRPLVEYLTERADLLRARRE